MAPLSHVELTKMQKRLESKIKNKDENQNQNENKNENSLLNLQSAIKYITVSVRLILPKVGLTNLHGHNEKVLLEKKMVFNSY